MRVYVPATLPVLAGWHEAGTTAAGLAAWAVTPALREWYAEGDDEELEWAAQTLAARASLRLLARAPLDRATARRVVLAVDVADADVVLSDTVLASDVDRGAVLLGAAAPVSSWAAALVDEPAAAATVSAAAAAIALADGGDDDAAFVVGEADDAELLWYAVGEIGAL